MTAGHFGFAAAVKSQDLRVPLWALMFSTYLLDFVFIILVAAGLENFAPLDPAHPAYGQISIHADYSHSLVGAALIALVAGLLAARVWGRRAGLIIGGVVMSHWVLDLLVHRPDLPILPGNAGSLPLLGFGLWQAPIISAILELILVVGGAYLYYRSEENAADASGVSSQTRSRVLATTGVTGLFTLLLLAADVLNLPLLVAVALMLLLIIFCGWLDARLNRSLPAVQAGSR